MRGWQQEAIEFVMLTAKSIHVGCKIHMYIFSFGFPSSPDEAIVPAVTFFWLLADDRVAEGSDRRGHP